MKARQFKALGGLSPADSLPLVLEGLKMIAAHVSVLAEDIESIENIRVHRAHSLLRAVAREEAGKFLLLLDIYRCPKADQSVRSRQFGRAGNHLAKLIYAEVADARIASQQEMLRLVDDSRQALYLDGPNDYDLIFRNRPLQDRDSELYVDLLEVEDDNTARLMWWQPSLDSSSDVLLPGFAESGLWRSASPGSVRLVRAIDASGLLTEIGLSGLSEAWSDFDPDVDSHCVDWQMRTRQAVEIAGLSIDGEMISKIADLWPMPLVTLDLKQIPVKVEELVEERERHFAALTLREYGDMMSNEGDYW